MTSPSDPIELIFITADPGDARIVADAGVDWVMVDLEILGKVERQGHLNTVISRHEPAQIDPVVAALAGTGARCLVRLNPLHDGSGAEIDDAVARGAARLMLPMFTRRDEVARFLALVAGRVPVTLLLETDAAFAARADILSLPGDYDVHVGLNDLHRHLGRDFMFELLVDGTVAAIAEDCRAAGRAFGIGGIAPLGRDVPLPAELILNEHAHLGSTRVILSRDWRQSLAEGRMAEDVDRLRAGWAAGPRPRAPDLARRIDAVAETLRARRRAGA